MKKQQKNKV